MALCTVDDIKSFLNITGTAQDALLQICLDSASQSIRDYLDSAIEQSSYTHFFDGTGLRSIVLRQRPVITVSSVYLDASGYYGQAPGGFPVNTLLVSGVDYVLTYDDAGSSGVSRSGILKRIGTGDLNLYTAFNTLAAGNRGSAWTRGTGTIKVVYTAGWPTVPPSIKLACISLSSLIYTNRSRAGLQVSSESLGSYSYSLSGSGGGAPEMGSVRQLLAAYREIRL